MQSDAVEPVTERGHKRNRSGIAEDGGYSRSSRSKRFEHSVRHIRSAHRSPASTRPRPMVSEIHPAISEAAQRRSPAVRIFHQRRPTVSFAGELLFEHTDEWHITPPYMTHKRVYANIVAPESKISDDRARTGRLASTTNPYVHTFRERDSCAYATLPTQTECLHRHSHAITNQKYR